MRWRATRRKESGPNRLTSLGKQVAGHHAIFCPRDFDEDRIQANRESLVVRRCRDDGLRRKDGVEVEDINIQPCLYRVVSATYPLFSAR